MIGTHVSAPEIILEMEATGISAQAVMGLDRIREKLCLASRRKTTLEEDAAYSLPGIFSISLSVVYGEGDKALGRPLAQLARETQVFLHGPGNPVASIVFSQPPSVSQKLPNTHVLIGTNASKMDMITAGLQAKSLDLTLVMKLYARLLDLSVLSFTGRRMKLPCMTFKLGPLLGS